MHGLNPTDISKFFVAGINYKKSDADIRGHFAINQEHYEKILSSAHGFGLHELFILSTCNRTEIYGFAEDVTHLMQLLCTQTEGSYNTFVSLSYTYEGVNAARHLFNVAAGLDSQILGDYEIVGQIRHAVKFSAQHGFIGVYLQRMVDQVMQSSKEIKNQTALSGGTVSVSFAAVQYIREKVARVSDKKILLVGVGKIGRNTCKNMVDYLGTRNIVLINRTEEKAIALAAELGLKSAPIEALAEEITDADMIVVATNGSAPTILQSHVENCGAKLIIDLSIPYNVETSVLGLPGITLVNVDELSKLKDQTLRKREAEVPKAIAIISSHIESFLDWHQMRRHVPLLKAVKVKLQEMNSCNFEPNDKIQRVIDQMAGKMRQKEQKGCYYIEAINDYMTIAAT
ncbi:MAG: glutamyl-tRNA reductase [Gemmatimonadaceae bacterium]|nr:glutamyl-tRNA reductase [Chitinophagaceae bacterium]